MGGGGDRYPLDLFLGGGSSRLTRVGRPDRCMGKNNREEERRVVKKLMDTMQMGHHSSAGFRL